jgi:HEXXH motif-containing protein
VLQPLPETGHVTSVTLGRLQGALIASLRDPVQVADALCHEGSHTRLGLLLHLDALLEDDGAAIHPSPWRQDPRPLKGLLNGVHAFVNVCEFYRRLASAEPTLAAAAEGVRELQRGRVLQAWDYLTSRARPTALGAFVMDDLAAAVEEALR